MRVHLTILPIDKAVAKIDRGQVLRDEESDIVEQKLVFSVPDSDAEFGIADAEIDFRNGGSQIQTEIQRSYDIRQPLREQLNVRNRKCGGWGTLAGHKLQDLLKVLDELFRIYAGCSEDLLSRSSQKIARFRYVHNGFG